MKTIREFVNVDKDKNYMIDGWTNKLLEKYIDQLCVIAYTNSPTGTIGIIKTKRKYKAMFISNWYWRGEISKYKVEFNDEFSTANKAIKSGFIKELLNPEDEAMLIALKV